VRAGGRELPEVPGSAQMVLCDLQGRFVVDVEALLAILAISLQHEQGVPELADAWDA